MYQNVTVHVVTFCSHEIKVFETETQRRSPLAKLKPLKIVSMSSSYQQRKLGERTQRAL